MAEDVFGIVGTVVGGAFSVEAVVAEGGFAVVYRAFHGAFHAPVALKCLKVPTVSRSSQRDFLERFREEGEVMFRLSQSIPAVVRPLHIDAFETPQGVFVPYMALEWLDGESLDVIIARRTLEGRPPMAVKAMMRLLSPVARALARAHRFPGPDGAVSITHRDLKPDNIMVANINGEEVVKVLDFGIAKVRSVASHNAGRMSRDGDQASVPFTPGYAAPEQWFPKRYGQTGPWTDVWGLALTIVETLSGKPAIDGDNTAMMGTAVDPQRRPTPRAEGAKVSDEVEAVFRCALSVDPRARYRDVGEFWDALEAAVGMQRTSTPGISQPQRDPRSDGGPTSREEVIEAALEPNWGSIRPPAIVRESRRPPQPEPAGLAAPAMPNIPDLELAVDVQSAVRKEQARRAESSAKLRAVTEQEVAFARPEPVGHGSSGKHQAVVIGPSDVMVAQASAPTSQGLEITAVRLDDEADNDGPGLDLAVSPEVVRRGSQHKLQAVGAQPPADAPASTSRSGQMRAVNPSATPIGQVRGLGPAGTPTSRSGQMHAVSAAPSMPGSGQKPQAPDAAAAAASARSLLAALNVPEPYRKLLLPVGLIAVGLVITLIFYVKASGGGGHWAIGPVSINWVAGVLVVAGTALLLVRVFVRDD